MTLRDRAPVDLVIVDETHRLALPGEDWESPPQIGWTIRSHICVAAGEDYLTFVHGLLSDKWPDAVTGFSGYDLQFFHGADAMSRVIREREAEFGLARLVAGHGWKWSSKGVSEDDLLWDIEVDGLRPYWNQTATNWINSPTSIREVGSIHTVQGHDLNLAGVIVGPKLYLDRATATTTSTRRARLPTTSAGSCTPTSRC